MRPYVHLALACLVAGLGACGDSSDDSDPVDTRPSNVIVRERIAATRPAVVLGHRGTGVNRPGHALAENSIASFVAAMGQGADGIELDVELTADGRLVVMHDDTLDRTTTCSGCVSGFAFDAVRLCRLVNDEGTPTSEPPPTLDEVFAALPAAAMVNIEMKVYRGACRTATTGAAQLAAATVAAVRRLGVGSRVLLSSFDAEAIRVAKQTAADLYTGFLVLGLRPRDRQTALDAGADAIHPGGPFPNISLSVADLVAARDAGLQLNAWTVNDAESVDVLLDNGVTAIITDEPTLVRLAFLARTIPD